MQKNANIKHEEMNRKKIKQQAVLGVKTQHEK
jgi:hypothetical protein